MKALSHLDSERLLSIERRAQYILNTRVPRLHYGIYRALDRVVQGTKAELTQREAEDIKLEAHLDKHMARYAELRRHNPEAWERKYEELKAKHQREARRWR